MQGIKRARLRRRKQTGERFTSPDLVNVMLDKFPEVYFSDQSKTFLDNSAGDGNFLVEVLKRKLSHGHAPLLSLSTIYGIELMADNVEIMKQRILDIILPYISEVEHQQAENIIDHQIVCHDALTWDYLNWKKPPIEKTIPLF